jgi:flagellar biosynthesis protein FlhF
MAAVDYNQPTSAVNTDASLPVTNSQQSAPRNMANDVVSIGQTEVNQSAPKQSMTSQLLSESETAPVDSLSALLNRKIQQEKNTSQAAQQGSDNENIEQQFKSFTERLEQKANRSDMQAAPNTPAADLTYGQQKAEPENSVSQNVSATQSADLEIAQMRQEMMSIRQLLEHQVSGLMWQDMAQKDPSKALMVNRLMSIGLNTQVAEQVSDCIPTFTNENEAWLQAKALLSQQLNTTNNDIIRNGGVVSLVGPTGVGKTTTVAKIAARFAQIHGADSVVMISTDNYRIAGFEQLSTYGRIIGCQVKLAKNATVLESLLQQYHDKKLVLIDTAGMGQRDIRLTEHLTTLITSSRVRIRNYLVLAANTQQQVMQENVERFKKVPLAGCIYTKLDESLSVGEIIATSIQNGLAIGYLTDGQRVPEDIKVANAEKLVTLADRLAEKVNKQYIPRPMPIKRAAMV